MKHCPYCAEEIQDAAVKCKHCGSWLNASAQETNLLVAMAKAKAVMGLPPG